jgi:hypothetical protein
MSAAPRTDIVARPLPGFEIPLRDGSVVALLMASALVPGDG